MYHPLDGIGVWEFGSHSIFPIPTFTPSTSVYQQDEIWVHSQPFLQAGSRSMLEL